MKNSLLSILLTPLVILSFLIASSDNYVRASLLDESSDVPIVFNNTSTVTTSIVTTNYITFSYSSDNQNWLNMNITQAQLDSAVYNPNTGQKELYLNMEVPSESLQQYVKASVIVTTNTFTSINNYINYTVSQSVIPLSITSVNNVDVPITYPIPMQMACAGLIVLLVAIVIVAGVVIYIFVKVCNMLNNPVKKKQNDDDNSYNFVPSSKLLA